MQTMFNKSYICLIAIVLITSCYGCGTGTVKTKVTSDPKKAEIYLNDQWKGTTPTILKLEDDMDTNIFHISAKKKGYYSDHVTIKELDKGAPPTDWIPTSLNMELEPEKQKTIDKESHIKKLEQKVNKNFSSSWRAPSKTRAVSIGISQFKDSTIPKVNYATKDAQYITSFINSSGVPQENITCLTNSEASRSDILDALSKLKMATTNKSETAIFYFSGHGAPILEDGKIVDAALMPYDVTSTNIKYSGIRISNLKEMLSDTQGNWIVILDACFSGKEGRSFIDEDVKSIAVVPKDYKVSPEKKSDSYWLTSTSGDNFANSFPKKEQGLFTYYLVQALNGEKGVDQNEDGLITLEEAFDWTKNKVSSVSKKSLGKPQYPELTGKGNMILTMPQ